MEPDILRVSVGGKVTIGARNLLRNIFCRSVELGYYPTAWSLRVGFVELMQRDAYLVLGYIPARIDSFMGLPITISGSGLQNRLITATGSMAVPELEDVPRTRSYADDRIAKWLTGLSVSDPAQKPSVSYCHPASRKRKVRFPPHSGHSASAQ